MKWFKNPWRASNVDVIITSRSPDLPQMVLDGRVVLKEFTRNHSHLSGIDPDKWGTPVHVQEGCCKVSNEDALQAEIMSRVMALENKEKARMAEEQS